MFEIDILRNRSQSILGVLKADFWGLGVQTGNAYFGNDSQHKGIFF